jgi:hypothetical protein
MDFKCFVGADKKLNRFASYYEITKKKQKIF